MKILNQKSLDEKLRQAASVVPEKMVSEIKSFVLSTDDAQLYHINPYRFAAHRKLDGKGALRAFLHMTKGGLFNLYWNIHCPACKGVTQHSNSLLTLKHADKCPVCSTVFDAGFDKSIETFQKLSNVIKMQSGGRFIEDEERTSFLFGSREVMRKFDALRLTA